MERTIDIWVSHKYTYAIDHCDDRSHVWQSGGKEKKNRGGVMVMLLFYRSTPEMADANPRNERSLLLSSL